MELTVHTIQVTQQDIDRVVKLTKRYTPSSTDHEDLAIGILIESTIANKILPTVSFIRFRCINHTNKHNRQRKLLESYARQCSSSGKDHLDHDTSKPKVDLNKLMAGLDTTERKLIFFRFWSGCTLEECARKLGFSPAVTRLTLLRALEKMRQSL